MATHSLPRSVSIPSGETARDGTASALLLAALVTSWDSAGAGWNTTPVLLGTLLALVGAILPHVPQVLVSRASWVIRLVAVAPLALLVAGALFRGIGVGEPIGLGVASAAAGAVLVATNRRDDDPATRGAAAMRAAAGFYLAGALLMVLVDLKIVLGLSGSSFGLAVTMPFLGFAVLSAIVGVSLLRAEGADWAAGLGLVILSSVAILIIARTSMTATNAARGAAQTSLWGVLVLCAVGAALSCAPGAFGTLPRMRGAALWVNATLGLLTVALVTAAATVVSGVMILVVLQAGGNEFDTGVIRSTVLGVAALVVSLVLRKRLTADPRRGRRLAVYAEGALLAAALVLFVPTSNTALDIGPLMVGFLVPVVTLALLTLPESMRALKIGEPLPIELRPDDVY